MIQHFKRALASMAVAAVILPAFVALTPSPVWVFIQCGLCEVFSFLFSVLITVAR